MTDDMWRSIPIAVLLSLGACFRPDLSAVRFRCPAENAQCDPGYECRQGWCLLPGEQPPSLDAAVPDSGSAPDLMVVDPWTVTLVSATIAPMNGGSGAPWDSGNPPDPFAVIEGKRTPTQQNTLTPSWNYSLTVPQAQLLAPGIRVQFFDDDGATNDKISNPRTVTFTAADLTAGMAAFMDWDSASRVTFTLRKQ